ncbi:hypothetical protein AK830_g11423 [Neonectria ditissima]|uniref:Uncharacterized protein n=1 Tax=Neonectria ditissima TaxID=78410 RepID=A0A0P7ARA1_9HYPO|nr:hypothetical protein AK830_g11423 [Neonectria ditissima]
MPSQPNNIGATMREPPIPAVNPEPHPRKKPRPRKATPRPVSNKFEFVSSDPGGKPDPNARKVIRSHVMRGKNTKRRCSGQAQVASLSNAEDRDDGLACSQDDSATNTNRSHSKGSDSIVVQSPCLPGFLPVSSDLMLFKFAAPLDRTSRYLIFRFLTTVKDTMYPVEWCFQYDRTKVCWFRWLLEDNTYLQSVLFMVSAFQDLVAMQIAASGSHVSWSGNFSPQTQRRLRSTIRLLQEKIQDRETQLEDTTMSVVTTLAMLADASSDTAAFEAHVTGLKEMVRMRGGLAAFNHNRQLQIKLCRVDLGWALSHGSKPEIYNGKISWEPFLETALQTSTIPYQHTPFSRIQNPVEALDYKLRNVFVDLRDFSGMANSLIANHEKLRPELFQEIMLSIQCRLLSLEYAADLHPLEESIRLGLLAFESTVFLQTAKLGVKLRSELFAHQLHRAIVKLHVKVPGYADLKLWLLLVGSILVFNGDEAWLLKSINELSCNQTWAEVRGRVKEVMWIDIIHDEPGRCAFETAQRGYVI